MRLVETPVRGGCVLCGRSDPAAGPFLEIDVTPVVPVELAGDLLAGDFVHFCAIHRVEIARASGRMVPLEQHERVVAEKGEAIRSAEQAGHDLADARTEVAELTAQLQRSEAEISSLRFNGEAMAGELARYRARYGTAPDPDSDPDHALAEVRGAASVAA